MNLVIDANILFSSFIKIGKTIDILLNPAIKAHTPLYVFEEVEDHIDEILSKTKIDKNEIQNITSSLLEVIKLVPNKELINFFKEAETISPDKDDTHYFALALKLKCPIWSNDKRLKSQKEIKIYSTEELNNILKTSNENKLHKEF